MIKEEQIRQALIAEKYRHFEDKKDKARWVAWMATGTKSKPEHIHHVLHRMQEAGDVYMDNEVYGVADHLLNAR